MVNPLKWLSFSILAFIVLILEVAIPRSLTPGSHNLIPNLFLILAAYLAFGTAAYKALIVFWILGLLKDISSDEILGCYSLSFGLFGIFLIKMRDLLNSNNPIVFGTIVLTGCLIIEHLALIIDIIRSSQMQPYSISIKSILLQGVISAILAPIISMGLDTFTKFSGVNIRSRTRRR